MSKKSNKNTLNSGFEVVNPSKPLAKMKVSISKKSITKLEVPKIVAMAKTISKPALTSDRINTSSLNRKNKRSKEENEAIDIIWQCLGTGKIDLKYATVGYGFNGRPILDHDLFVNLLINYGFTIGIVLDFIDDFNLVSAKDNDFPMVMVSDHMQKIYQEVKNIDELPKSKS